MTTFVADVREWAEQQFGECELGHVKRTARAVEFAAQAANDCSGSTPRQAGSWAGCKAAYRLMNCPDVTFAALTAPHYRQSRAAAPGHCLLLGDTTEIEFGMTRKVTGLGPTGDGGGRGFLLHSSLIVTAHPDPQQRDIIGLAGQELFYRRPKPAKETRAARRKRARESEVWGRVIDQVGTPGAEQRWTHVFDRGADNFEVYVHLLQNQVDWLVRVSHLSRQVAHVLPASGELQTCSLDEYLAPLPSLGSYELTVRAQKDQPAHTAVVEVRVGQVMVQAPRARSPWLRETGIEALAMWVVEVRETHPPAGVQPLHWVLYTSHAVTTFDEAWLIIGFYEQRWLIEEYHKALKTGTCVEDRQYRTSARLEAVTGLLAIVALRLLQLKMVARHAPDLPAAGIVPQLWIEVLQVQRKRPRERWTVRDFFRHLAGLGGFLGRTSDGEPGWLTIWRGFAKLAPALDYAHQLQKRG